MRLLFEFLLFTGVITTCQAGPGNRFCFEACSYFTIISPNMRIDFKALDEDCKKSSWGLMGTYNDIRMIYEQARREAKRIFDQYLAGDMNHQKRRLAPTTIICLFVVNLCNAVMSSMQIMFESKMTFLLLSIAVVTCYGAGPYHTWQASTCRYFLKKSPNAKIEIEKIMEECKKGDKRLETTCQPKFLEWIKEKKYTSRTWDQACPRIYARRN
ncbi:unnamed protein product [Cylicocyclus nassatus]|uniref:C-type lectin domain-containing protein n=1 Tax=Cylicocyclus nassatus TaxID=53992 RepID=A0AA36HD52_CYLNA|nr:unnamed protein product [Cylicocyclus nassatus]